MSQLHEQAAWNDTSSLEKLLLSFYVHPESRSKHVVGADQQHRFKSISAAVDTATRISERIHELKRKNGTSATTGEPSNPAPAGSSIQSSELLPTARIHVVGGGMTVYDPILLELDRCCRLCNFDFVGEGGSDCDDTSAQRKIDSGTAPIPNSVSAASSSSSTSADAFRVEVSSSERAPLEINFLPGTSGCQCRCCCPGRLGFIKFSHFQFCRLPTQAQSHIASPSAGVERMVRHPPEDENCSGDSDSSQGDSDFHDETNDLCCAVLQWRKPALRLGAGDAMRRRPTRAVQLLRPRICFHNCVFRAGERNGDGLRVVGAFDLQVERCTFSGARSTPRLRRVVDALVVRRARKGCDGSITSGGGNGVRIQNSGLCSASFAKCEVRRVVDFGFWFAYGGGSGDKKFVESQQLPPLSSSTSGSDPSGSEGGSAVVVNPSVQVHSCSVKEVTRGSGIIVSSTGKFVDEQPVQAQLQLLQTEVSQCAVAGLLIASGMMNSPVSSLTSSPVLDVQVDSCAFHHCRGDGLRVHVVGLQAGLHNPIVVSAATDGDGFTSHRLRMISSLVFDNGGAGVSIGSSSTRLPPSEVTRHAAARWLVHIEGTTIRSNGKVVHTRHLISFVPC